jgi:hypothetical protein
MIKPPEPLTIGPYPPAGAAFPLPALFHLCGNAQRKVINTLSLSVYPRYAALAAVFIADPRKTGFNMKILLFAAATVLATATAFAGDVGTLGGLGEPGYGQIDIHKFPKPDVVNPDPVVVRSVDGSVAGEPVYLRVPPEHAKNWRKHCQKYNACDQRVYFIEETWYNKVYMQEMRKAGETEKKP